MALPSQILECIVNVSEGRDKAVIQRISSAISQTEACALLHQDSGASAHRTVFTFAGAPGAVIEAAYRVYAIAAECIDMRQHRGEHPRMGAVDVCPFVPIKGVKMKEVVALTQVLGKRLGEELDIPVYLYEQSASAEHRRNLAKVRQGEYEGLPQKITDPEWQPEFGPTLNPRFGASALGARPYLIAWNINLSPDTDINTARHVARQLRGSGFRGQPGLFPGLKAISWYLEDFGRCQISCNVVDPDRTDLARVYLTAVNLVEALGGKVTGSELIGLIPEKYLLRAGKVFTFSEEADVVLPAAVEVLGLNDLHSFDYRERVLERAMARVWGGRVEV